MTTEHRGRRIVVGYDGSPASHAALAHELIHLADCPITVIPERVVDREQKREKAGATS